MAKRTVPLGQFKFGEISPQAAQSLSPKESPYALRKAKNCFVDLLSGIKTRQGTEYLADVDINPPIDWYSEGLFYETNQGVAFGEEVKLSAPYMIVMSEHKTDSSKHYYLVFSRQGGEWVKIWEKEASNSEKQFDISGNRFVIMESTKYQFYEINNNEVTEHSSRVRDSRDANIGLGGDDLVVVRDMGNTDPYFYIYRYDGSSWNQRMAHQPTDIFSEGSDKGIFYHGVSYNGGDWFAVKIRRKIYDDSYSAAAYITYYRPSTTSWITFLESKTRAPNGEVERIKISSNPNGFVVASNPQGASRDLVMHDLSTGSASSVLEIIDTGASILNLALDESADRMILHKGTTTLDLYVKQGDNTWIVEDTITGLDIDNNDKTEMEMSGNFIVYGMSESNPSTGSLGSVASIAYKQGSFDYSIVSVVDPFTSEINLYLATAGSIKLAYGTSSIAEILAPNGVEAIPLTYSQWDKYLLYIDRNQTGLYIADVTSSAQFQTIEAFLNNAGNNPDWGADIPKSMDFHEGRMVFCSDRYFYGAALSYVATGGYPFTFPGVTTTIDGDAVPTPANSFKFSPIGGGDIGFSWIASGSFLFAASKKSFWNFSDPSGGVNPSAPNMHKLTSLGCSSVKGIQTAGGCYYFQGDEKTVMGIVYNRDGAVAVPINTASRHFFKEHKPVKMVITSGNESTIWILRSDGKLVTYQLNNENMFNAEGSWAMHDFGGVVEDISAYETPTESSLVISIKRSEPLGESFTVMEKVTTESRYVDSHVFLATGDSVTAERFKNTTVHIEADEGSYDVTADANGVVTFPETLTNAVVGIAFECVFVPRVFPDVHGKDKGRIISIAPIVEDTVGFLYGPEEDQLSSEFLTDDAAFTGQVRNLSLATGVEYMPKFVMKALPGQYMEVNAIYVEVE